VCTPTPAPALCASTCSHFRSRFPSPSGPADLLLGQAALLAERGVRRRWRQRVLLLHHVIAAGAAAEATCRCRARRRRSPPASATEPALATSRPLRQRAQRRPPVPLSLSYWSPYAPRRPRCEARDARMPPRKQPPQVAPAAQGAGHTHRRPAAARALAALLLSLSTAR